MDKDGKVDYNEFIQATINHQANLNKKNIKEIFNIFDLDNDGKIDMKELKQVFCKEQIGVFKDNNPENAEDVI